MPTLSRTHWKDGNTVLKFSDGSGYGKFTLSDNTSTWNLYAYDVTPVSFQFHTDYNAGGNPMSGTYANGTLDITTGANIVADNSDGVITETTPRQPVLDLD